LILAGTPPALTCPETDEFRKIKKLQKKMVKQMWNLFKTCRIKKVYILVVTINMRNKDNE
jgi:hypothetical protein